MEKDRDTLRGQEESNPDADFGKQFGDSESSIDDLYQKIQSLTISMEKSKGKVADTEYTVLLQERDKLLQRLNEAKKKLDIVRLKLLQLAEDDGIPSSPTASFVGLNNAALSIIATSANPSTSPTEDKMDQ
eukprot:TRINITY_DN11737_c0_g1_i1.p1 TRINITY_DN11737_c0_g1~~TRINITY_DN11737_c0_g1_i1.p1  ORF type:complete len:131 (-),score=13.83 TRINITY_DN11737_c0_g1_i1:112-504(-)